MSSYAKYGSYTHTTNELNIVRFDLRAGRSPRNRQLWTDHTLYCYGELQETGQALIDKVNELALAYSEDYRDFQFFVDGTEVISLKNNQFCLTGVQVLQRSFPQGDGAEYATKRSYVLTLRARYAKADDGVVAWKERIRFEGNCGPRAEIVQTYGGPVSILTAVATAQRITQYGRSIGFLGHALPYGPIFPEIEHQDQRMIELAGGDQQGLIATNYETIWAYRMTSNTPLVALPSTV